MHCPQSLKSVRFPFLLRGKLWGREEDEEPPHPGIWLKPLAYREAGILAQLMAQGLLSSPAINLQFSRTLTRNFIYRKGHVQSSVRHQWLLVLSFQVKIPSKARLKPPYNLIYTHTYIVLEQPFEI